MIPRDNSRSKNSSSISWARNRSQFYGIAAARLKILESLFEIHLVDFPDKKDNIQVVFSVKRSV